MNRIAEQALARARGSSAPSAPPSSKPTRKFWTASDEIRLASLYGDTPMPELIRIFGRPDHAIYGKAASMGLKRSEAYLASEHACRLRREDNPGIDFRFQKGDKPWNAGLTGLPSNGRSPETQFKVGQNPHNWNPIGHERVTKDGYLQRKMTDTKCTRKDYRMVHHLVWEEVNGPVPAGHALVFKDGVKTNIEIGNLELLTRAELCRRNSIHRYPPELKEIIRLQKKLERTIRKQNDEK